MFYRYVYRRIGPSVVLGLIILISTNGCVSYNQLVNYQGQGVDTTALKLVAPPPLTIQPNDVLSIKVYGANQEIAAPFNVLGDQSGGFNIQSIQISGYLVSKEGLIDFPVLGSIYLAGLTTSEAKDKVRDLLTEHLKDPGVNLRLLNFRVTVSGEVVSPGMFTVLDERISVPDALSLAGGLSDYANRSNILIVRESQGQMTLKRVNLQSADFFNSEYYYLKQNDLIYVEPLRSKAGAVSDQTNKVVPIISVLGTLVAIAVALLQ